MSSKVKRRSWKVHAIAQCEDCDWGNTLFTYAVDGARRHAQSTGHVVTYETGSAGVFNEKRKDT